MLDIKQISQIVYNAVNEAFSIYDNVENAILVYYNTLNENLPDFIDHENSDKFYNNDYYFQPTTHPYIKEEYRVFVKNHINEAVKLYPKSLSAEDTLSAIKNSIYLKDEWIYVKKYNSTDKLPRCIKISVPVKKLNSEFENILKIAFHTCGYFLAADWGCEYNGKLMHSFQFEAFYYTGYKLTANNLLYHITSAVNKNGILNNGFKISSKNLLFDYPDRLYFFLIISEPLIKNLFYKSKKFNKENEGNNKITIFELIAELLINKIEFYSDPMYEKNMAVYTYQNIGKEYIQEIRETFI